MELQGRDDVWHSGVRRRPWARRGDEGAVILMSACSEALEPVVLAGAALAPFRARLLARRVYGGEFATRFAIRRPVVAVAARGLCAGSWVSAVH